jgi:hypothetical protein
MWDSELRNELSESSVGVARGCVWIYNFVLDYLISYNLTQGLLSCSFLKNMKKPNGMTS